MLGKTGLLMAASGGFLEAAQLLLGTGCDPNKPDTTGITPLHAATLKSNEAMVRLLLRHGANPMLPEGGPSGHLPIQVAARQTGHEGIVAALLAAGPPQMLQAVNRQGYSLLGLAVQGDQPGAVRQLVAAGASPAAFATTEPELHPLHQAAMDGALKALRALLEGGCAVQVQVACCAAALRGPSGYLDAA